MSNLIRSAKYHAEATSVVACIVSVVIGGGVVALACNTVDGDFNFVTYAVVTFICAVVGAVIAAVNGRIMCTLVGYRYSWLDFWVAVSSIAVGAVIGGFFEFPYIPDVVFGFTFGLCVACGSFIAFLAEGD
ncbi:hypothetical protein GCM10010191_58610 [Actinomadura vinacea]|uniref:Uncharacterized protein n=1 Tax=Actinomadura vinacea TaxID=115336 RepID=A0ABP5WWX4_9ACTN